MLVFCGQDSLSANCWCGPLRHSPRRATAKPYQNWGATAPRPLDDRGMVGREDGRTAVAGGRTPPMLVLASATLPKRATTLVSRQTRRAASDLAVDRRRRARCPPAGRARQQSRDPRLGVPRVAGPVSTRANRRRWLQVRTPRRGSLFPVGGRELSRPWRRVPGFARHRARWSTRAAKATWPEPGAPAHRLVEQRRASRHP